MSSDANNRTLDLNEAASFLKIHPVTLSVKACAGEIQGAKIGKRWVFLEVDLIDHIRGQYKSRALEGEHERKSQLCHSTSAKTPVYGGLKSPSLEKTIQRSTGTEQRAQAQEFHDRLKTAMWEQERLGLKARRSWQESVVRWLRETSDKATHQEDIAKLKWLNLYLGEYC